MKNIKFRAWNKGNKIYLYNVQDAYDTLSGFVKYDDGENGEYDECYFGDFLNNKRYDVEQFIDLKDVNGKDIYEDESSDEDNQLARDIADYYCGNAKFAEPKKILCATDCWR